MNLKKIKIIKYLLYISLLFLISCEPTAKRKECIDECSYTNEAICESNTTILYKCIRDKDGCFIKLKDKDCERCESNKCKTKCDDINCNNGTCDESSGEAICSCKIGFHNTEENGCELNTKKVNCIDNAPTNATSTIVELTLEWDKELNQWPTIIDCDWNCNQFFHTEDNISCISDNRISNCNKVDVDSPENSSFIDKEINETWTEEDGWKTTNCQWECNEGYEKGNNVCLKINVWNEISVGNHHFCGIKGGNLYCWGHGNLGELGLGESVIMQGIPMKIGTKSNWSNVTSGEKHSCAIRNNRAYCWGDEEDGKLGIELSGNRYTPTQVVKLLNDETNTFEYYDDWERISAFQKYTCGIRSGKLYCWGYFPEDDRFLTRYKPYQIGSSSNWKEISTGRNYTIGIKNDGLLSWGANYYGKLGNSRTDGSRGIEVIDNSIDWKKIDISLWHSCGIKYNSGENSGDKLYCWGYNLFGQLGIGVIDPLGQSENLSPIKVDDNNWKMIALGKTHTCGIQENNKLYCWGQNIYKQLGIATSTDTEHCVFDENGNIKTCSTPQLVTEDDWLFISAGFNSTCGIKMDGKLYCWGYNGIDDVSSDGSYVYPTLIE